MEGMKGKLRRGTRKTKGQKKRRKKGMGKGGRF
jgi:hypothetical protein